MPVTIKLTDKEAHLIWGILDGAADAGACEDGLTKAEHRAIAKVINIINTRKLEIMRAARTAKETTREA